MACADAFGSEWTRLMKILLPVDGSEAALERHACDAIILGARGLGALLGSVSQAVLAAAKVPVTIVKDPAA